MWRVVGLIATGAIVRVILLPQDGFVGDIDQFVAWVRHIQANGLGHAYDEQLSFGPVMALVWWLQGLVAPGLFWPSADAATDVGLRVFMKLPATLADFGLAGLAWYALRSRPRVALLGAAVVLLHPVVWLVSAWWGQYESIYTLLAVAALVLAVRGHDALAVVALAAALMTKPQVAPLLVPFAAWLLARRGPAALARLTVVGAATAIVLWLPFVPAGGPARYVDGLIRFQTEFYAVLSLNAWNLWWAFQELAAPGGLIADTGRLAGPLSFRLAGYMLAALLLAIVAYGVWRRPSARSLALGMAAAALAAFGFMTTMHERYAFAAVPLLALLVDDRRARLLALAFGVTYAANLFAVASTAGSPGFVSVGGWFGVLGSLVGVAGALGATWELVRRDADGPAPALAIKDLDVASGPGVRLGTSAGSGAATSGA